MQAQGELLRKEMEAQEARQRSAIEDLMEAIDVRAQVAELGEDVRCLEEARSFQKKHPKIMIFQKNRGLQDPPVCYACAFQHIWAEVTFPDVQVLNSIFAALFHCQLLLPHLQPDKLGRGVP